MATKSRPKGQLLIPETSTDFVCVFVDGPWAGNRVTYKRDMPKFEIGKPRSPEESDSMFRYDPLRVTNTSGVKETEYHLTYDGPTFTGGKHGEE